MLNIKSITEKCQLNDGYKIPWLGFGTYQLTANDSCTQIVEYALKSGYRHIDTAAIYGNEADIAKAIRNSGLKREDIFVTTKLWNDDQGKDKAAAALKKSLHLLGLDYVDLYLIHWPVKNLRLESWDVLVNLKQDHYTKSIGVSNYTIDHLQELFANSVEKPAINQVEFSPYLYQKGLVDFCAEHDIVLQAYSPLIKGRKLDNPLLLEIAKKYNKTSAQVVLRWILQLGVIVLPKTKNKNRVLENMDIFDFHLTVEDHAKIASLDIGYRTSWDPTTI